jgi:DNA-binding NarL/FixJ family response regulator
MRCVIVEDEVMFAQMLAAMLQSVRGLEVAALTHTAAEGVAACREFEPELLILDLGLPDGNGMQVAREAIKARSESRIIVLSSQAATFVAPAALNRSIHAVIDKTRAYEELQREVLSLWRDQAPGSAPSQPEDVLTSRELEVFRLLGKGLMSKEMASELGISPATVALHRKRIASKLRVRGSELLNFAALHRSSNHAREA